VHQRNEINTADGNGDGVSLLVLAARLTKPVQAIRQVHSASDHVTLQQLTHNSGRSGDRGGARRLVDRLPFVDDDVDDVTSDVIIHVISAQNAVTQHNPLKGNLNSGRSPGERSLLKAAVLISSRRHF